MGELGTNPRDLEQELTKILDVAHSWGAVLLLDEADVFLEARTAQDIHRNALVSIFLRLLEYFQGILFLTTNRVATFDDAFQSRIHIALRYSELDFKARRTIFHLFISRVQTLNAPAAPKPEGSKPDAKSEESSNATPTSDAAGGSDKPDAAAADKPAALAKLDNFTDADLDRLARRGNLNGRQIKNAVRSAQALALTDGTSMNMTHLMKVLEVSEAFERDLKGNLSSLGKRDLN